MADMNCCYKCQEREVGCAIDCERWAARHEAILKIREQRRLQGILDDHDRKAYMNFKRDAQNRNKRKQREQEWQITKK